MSWQQRSEWNKVVQSLQVPPPHLKSCYQRRNSLFKIPDLRFVNVAKRPRLSEDADGENSDDPEGVSGSDKQPERHYRSHRVPTPSHPGV